MGKESSKYLLISPCRNEEEYMRKTLDSVVRQSVLPAKWIIIDDGSTDNTPKILNEYANKFSWIEILTREDRGKRAVGPGVIEAFYTGYNAVNLDDYEYLCKLDLDLDLPIHYFKLLINKMKLDPRQGTCSGKSYIYKKGLLVSERKGDDTSLGMTKFYRVSCFKEIGGFVHEVMWDGIDCHRCRMLGWKASSWDEPELRFIHLRPMGSSQQNIFVGRMRHGFGQYFMGTGFVYILASVIFRLNEKPYIFGSLAVLWGWLRSALLRMDRYDDPEFRKFLNHYQWRSLLVGKKRALAEIESHW